MVEHMVNNVKAVAVLFVRRAIRCTSRREWESTPYPIYAERSGLCIPESIVVLLCAVFYLSLIRTASAIPKIGVVVSTIIVCFVCILARLILICVAATYDKDIAGLLEVITTYFASFWG